MCRNSLVITKDRLSNQEPKYVHVILSGVVQLLPICLAILFSAFLFPETLAPLQAFFSVVQAVR